jgi:hypothetical protein
MAGNKRSGRRQNRPERPASPSERPRKPSDLEASCSDYWDIVVSNALHLTTADEDLLLSCVQLRELYRQSHAAASCDPLNKDARIAVCAYHTQWKATLAVLCLDPLGRKRAHVPEPEVDDPLKALGIVG